MSIASELTDLNTNLTAAKNAVTTKGGTVGDTGLAGLASEIGSIPSGGGGEKVVKFVDYDGTIINEYTVTEANNLSALPTAPTHTGLEFVEWTETLAHVNAATGSMLIGATYQDAQSHGNDTVITFYPYSTSDTHRINFQQDVANGVTIDWGDGSATETVAGTGNVYATHTYSSVNDAPYTIRLTPAENVKLTLGSTSSASVFVFSNAAYSWGKIVVGRCSLGGYGLYDVAWCKEVILSNKVTEIGWTSLSGSSSGSSCYRCLVIPNGATLTGGTSGIKVVGKYLQTLVLPSSYTIPYLTISSEMLNEIIPYPNLTKINISSVRTKHLIIPNTITTLQSVQNTFMEEITIPASVTSIQSNVFTGCYNLHRVVLKDRANLYLLQSDMFNPSQRYFTLAEIDCTDFTQVPPVNSSFFTGLPKYTKILVPLSLEADWKAANTWKQHTDQIVGV